MTDVYAVMREGLLIATGEPGDWDSETHFAGTHVECVDASPDAPGRVFCGTFGDGLHRSVDGGDAWERVGADTFDVGEFTSVAVSPHDPDLVWAGTEPSELYRSTDGGAAWEKRPGIQDLPSADEWWFPPRPEMHRIRCIEPDATDPDRLLMGVELGAFVLTEDAGETYTEDVPGARDDTHQMVVHPDDPDRLYAASGFGYAQTRDGGRSWERPEEGLTEEYEHLWSVAVDPGDPDTVVASTSEDAFAAHFEPAETYVHRQKDDGAWEKLDGDGLPTGEGVFATSLAPGTDDGELYAVNNRGLFRSTDAGDAWSALDVDWPNEFEAQDPRGLVVVS